MRTAFINTLIDLAEHDSRIVLMVGDLGFGVVIPFMEKYTNQIVNAGVAEQNMTGMAAGMALSGKIVFTYSIANFPVLRCLEQIRNDVCYHNANVKIVPVGGGMAYGSLGPSHHATEDIAIMRALPNMTVLAPGDPIETDLAVRALVATDGPAYLRLGRAGEPIVHQTSPEFVIGKAMVLQNGSDITLISTGGLLHETMKATHELEKTGLSVSVISMCSIKPLDVEIIIQSAQSTKAIFTIEEHSVIGGLGSAVAEVLAENNNLNCLFHRIGLKSQFSSIVGSQEYLRDQYSINAKGIVKQINQIFSK